MKVQTPELGGIVKSRYGRDKGRLYLIVRAEGRTLYLADGRYRGYKNPKKKNIAHVELLPEFFPEIAKRLGEGKDENSNIRAAVQKVSLKRGETL